jgi:hypothetical protein
MVHGVRGTGVCDFGHDVSAMVVTCSPCTTDDVVHGLAQISGQVQGLAAYFFVVSVVLVMVVTVSAVVGFYRR